MNPVLLSPTRAHSRTAAESDKWSTIQIITPIIVGLGVAALAAVLFFLYRRRRRTGSFFGKGSTQKAWESAHLHGPRRFFGLIPDRFAVQPRARKETAWEIDSNDAAQVLYAPADVGARGSPTSFQEGHQRVESRASGHSRTESTTSLITSGSQHSSKSFLTNIAAKFHFSSGRAYQTGTTKGPDYRRVQVIQENPGRRFKIDGSETPALNNVFSFPPPPEPTRHDSLPSVIDIRRPTTAEGSQRRGQYRFDSFPPPRRFTGDDDGTRTELTDGPRSDFTLGTTDLMTPVDSLESGERGVGVSLARVSLTVIGLIYFGIATTSFSNLSCVTFPTCQPLRDLPSSRRAPIGSAPSQCVDGHIGVPTLPSRASGFLRAHAKLRRNHKRSNRHRYSTSSSTPRLVYYQPKVVAVDLLVLVVYSWKTIYPNSH